LYVKNNSPYKIAVRNLPDTITDHSRLTIGYLVSITIKPGAVRNMIMPIRSDAYSWEIKKSVNKKLNLFFFNVDTLLKYNDLNYVYTKKLYTLYSFSEEELDSMNWIVNYP
jgi:hypothetical protein